MSDVFEGEEQRAVGSDRRSKYRRQKDRELAQMASQAIIASQRAVDLIDAHVKECSASSKVTQYELKNTKELLRTVLAVVGAGTVLIVTGLATIAYVLFTFVLSNADKLLVVPH